MAAPAIEAFLRQLDPTVIRPGLQRIHRLLKALDHPEARLKAILIGGTNGKGSVAACLSSILAADGARVATYTSPHLRTLSERITLNGKPISQKALARHFRRVKNALELVGEATYFEFVTALAFDYFGRVGPDWAVLEVGLGGRWDAVNVAKPELCVLTPIGLDHTELLGFTLEAVAEEKAAVVRPGRAVVCGRQPRSVLRIVETVCHERRAPLSVLGRAFRLRRGAVSDEGQVFTYMEAGLTLEDLALPLLGAHQADNAACAVRAYRQLCHEGWLAWSEAAVQEGLAAVRMEGRLQVLSRDPFVVVDGAHNAMAARALAHEVRSLWPHRPLTLVFGVLHDKDYRSMAKTLFPLASRVVLVPVSSVPDRSADPHEVATKTVGQARDLLVVPDLTTALREALADLPADGLCLITGSLALAGEAIALLEEPASARLVR
ncbi:MAG: bifunctional folylpolyglutamate synthase/dihydrofolate synthase [Nitrospinota bacterium]